MVKKYTLSKCIRWANLLNDNHKDRYGVCDTSESLTSPASAEVYSSYHFKTASESEHWAVWDHELYCVVCDPLAELRAFALYERTQSGVPAVYQRRFALSETLGIYHFLSGISTEVARDSVMTAHIMAQRDYKSVSILKTKGSFSLDFDLG